VRGRWRRSQASTPGLQAARPGSLLVWRALRWRAGSSMTFFAVSVAAIVAAAAGPVYLHGADQTLLSTTLSSSSVVETGVSLSPESSSYVPPRLLLDAAASVPGGAGRAAGARFEAPITTVDVNVRIPVVSAGVLGTMQLVSRSGACNVLRFVAGGCPRRAGEVVLTTRTAKALGVRVGGSVHPLWKGQSLPALRVTGLVLPGDTSSPYWWENDYFPYGTSGPYTGPIVDDGFVSQAEAGRLATLAPTSDLVQLPLRTASLGATAVPAFLHALASWTSRLGTRDAIHAETQLPAVLAGASNGEGAARTIVAVVSLELVLLALLVVFAIARTTSALREPDVRVAELRGLPKRSMVRIALREPVLMLLAALPIGLAVAYFVLLAVDRAVLGTTSGTTLDSLAIEAGVAGCLAGLVAAALGSQHVWRDRRPDEPPAAEQQRRSRRAAVLDALAVALAAAGVAEMAGQSARSGSGVAPLAYLGPGLLALGVSVLTARALVLLARRAVRALGWSRRVALSLALRNLGRRPGRARQAIVPAIASGLLVFAVAGSAVAGANHAMQARFEVGAPVVLDVAPRPGVDLLTAVRRADPSGDHAMAAARISTSTGTTLAVDPQRFAAVASWPSSLSPTSAEGVARELAPPTPPPRLVPAAAELLVSADELTPLTPGPDLQAELFDLAGEGELTVDFGDLRPGFHTYSADLAGLCPGGCRLDQLDLAWTSPGAGQQPGAGIARSYQLRISSVATRRTAGAAARPIRALLGGTGTWRASAFAVVAGSESQGLEIEADLIAASSSGGVTVSPFDVPPVLPAVATSELVGLDGTPSDPNRVYLSGLDGSDLSAQARTVVPALPSVGNDASMIDLSFAERLMQGQPLDVTWQVWCSGTPSAGLLSRLRREGVAILSVHRASSALAAIDRSGPAVGFSLYTVAAAAAALLALGVLLFDVASEARRRRIELSGLSAVGIPLRALRRSLLVESSVLAVAGAVAGTVATMVSASLALAFLPEFPPGRVGPPLATGLPWLDVVLTGLAMLVLLEAAALAASVAVVAGVRPEQLRMAQ
jgi:putative ABC transport system permease protein